MEKIYFSKNNFNILYNIIGDNIFKKYQYDLSQDSHFETELMNTLKSVYANRSRYNISRNLQPINYSNELSKKVLDTVLNNIKKKFERNNNGSMNTHIKNSEDINNSISNRNLGLNNDHLNMISNRPIPSVVNNTQDMNFKYEQLQNERSSANNNLPRNDSYNHNSIDNIHNSANYNRDQYTPSQTIINNVNEVTNSFEKLQSLRNNELERKKPENIDFRLDVPKYDSNINSKFEQEQEARNKELNIIDKPNTNLQNNNLQTNTNLQSDANLQNNYISQNNDNLQRDANLQNNNTISQNNNFLPGLNETEDSGLDSQFSSLFQSESDINNLANKFEEKSIHDRLAEFQKSRNADINIETSDNNTESNEVTSKLLTDTKINYREPESKKPIELSIQEKTDNSNNLDTFFNNNIPKKPKEPEVIETSYNLIVNSIDRKWEGVILDDGVNFYESSNSSRYDYIVNFNPSYDSFVNIPVYENNEYIAYDFSTEEGKKKIMNGIKVKNTDGFFFKNKAYSKYDPNKPKGEKLAEEIKVIKGSSTGVIIDNSFKNVVSIKLKRLILPTNDVYMHLNYTLGSEVNKKQYIATGSKKFPYLMLKIKEFHSNIVSTSSFNKPIFCKAHYDKDFCYTEDNCVYRGWVYYKNDDNDVTEFYPSPLVELNKLSIQILKPDGSLYSDETDNLRVIELKCTNPSNNSGESCFILTLNKYVSSKCFRLGDKILIKCLTFTQEISDNYINLSDSEKDILKKGSNIIKNYFENGAYVLGTKDKNNQTIGEYSKDMNINQLVIKYKISGIDNTGNNIYFGNNNEIDTINKLSDLMVNDNKFTQCNGFLLNTNLQHTLVFEVKVQKSNSNQLV